MKDKDELLRRYQLSEDLFCIEELLDIYLRTKDDKFKFKILKQLIDMSQQDKAIKIFHLFNRTIRMFSEKK